MTSATYAEAEVNVAEENTPCKNLVTKSQNKELAIAKIKKAKLTPIKAKEMIGFLPKRSDNLPQMGAKKNSPMAKEAAKKPIVNSEA